VFFVSLLFIPFNAFVSNTSFTDEVAKLTNIVFLFEVIRGFLARRRCKRLREEAIINTKKAATFLQYSSVCGNKLFLMQGELLQHDYKKKEGIITVIQKSCFI